MMHNRKIIGILGLCILLAAGCYYDNEEELYPEGTAQNPNEPAAACDTTEVSFSLAVFPIIQSNCLPCHSASRSSGNVVLEDHGDVLVEVNSGRLMGTITHSPGFSPMPRNANKLPDCEISTVQAWVKQGAENN
ncbi:MAG: hypothetical protein AAF694_13530 [Bacteroidota bacterium]